LDSILTDILKHCTFSCKAFLGGPIKFEGNRSRVRQGYLSVHSVHAPAVVHSNDCNTIVRWFGASANALVFTNLVALRRIRLLLGWVTVVGIPSYSI